MKIRGVIALMIGIILSVALLVAICYGAILLVRCLTHHDYDELTALFEAMTVIGWVCDGIAAAFVAGRWLTVLRPAFSSRTIWTMRCLAAAGCVWALRGVNQNDASSSYQVVFVLLSSLCGGAIIGDWSWRIAGKIAPGAVAPVSWKGRAAGACVAFIFVFVPNFMASHTTASADSCINHLRIIDSAKQQWALEKSKGLDAIPSPSDLQPYLGRGANGELPVCPYDPSNSFETSYSINRVGDKPTCKIRPQTDLLP